MKLALVRNRYTVVATLLMAVLALVTACSAPAPGAPAGAVQAPEPLNLEALQNAEYQGIYEGQVIQLTDGRYEGEPFVEGGASRPTVIFIEPYAFGDLNGDDVDDAVALLVENSGGSGSFVYLAALLNQNGLPNNVATQLLGDRTQVQALAIDEGIVRINIVTHGPEDPMCCPSLRVVETYELQGDTLVQLSREEQCSGTLTVEALQNAEYQGIYEGQVVQLTDGRYEGEPFVEGGASRPTVTFIEPYAFGDLDEDGEDDAVVLLVESSGGSGSFVYLAVLVNECGSPVNVATHFLSDRARVQALAIADGIITVDMLAHGPDDPMCCPSQRVIETYALQWDALVQLSHEEKTVTDLTGLVDIIWTWQRLTSPDGQDEIVVPDPLDYRLELDEDGTYQAKADCNLASGGYEVDGDSLTLLPGPMTLAECEPGSFYYEYLSYLGAVESYIVQGDALLLKLAADGPTMHFAKHTPK
jgi:heat shock protein HslJ